MFQSKSILKHIAKSKDCKEKYNPTDLQNLRDLSSKRCSKRKRECYEANSQNRLAKQRKYNQEHAEEIKLKQKEYNKKNSEKIRLNQAAYDKEHSEEIRLKQAAYNREHSEEIRLKQAAYNREHSEEIRQKNDAYNKEHSEEIRLKQKSLRQSRKGNQEASTRVLKFKQDNIEGPDHDCYSCHRALFKNSVKILSKDELQKIIQGCKESYLRTMNLLQYRFFAQLTFCHGCLNKVRKQLVPSIHFSNGLLLDDVPEELKKLTELEHQLILPNLIFMKIKRLPKTGMRATHDRIISVPLDADDVSRTVSTLPRHPSEAMIVAVRLKRKLEMNNIHLKEFIRPIDVIRALMILKSLKNPFYEDVNIDTEVLNRADSTSLENQPDELEDSDDDIDSDDDEFENNPVKKFQVRRDEQTCLMPQNLETEVVVNQNTSETKKLPAFDGESIDIAPGEGKIPTNYLRQEHFDVKSFVRHHPTGRFGMNYQREFKLSDVMYVNQRLLNKDSRFSNDPFYVFMCAAYLERLALEKQISISGLKGVGSNENHQGMQVHLKDPYDVFKKIKGSPRYWQTARHNLMAKVKQLGAFQIFFTLSCGEMRWPEVFMSVLKRKGYKTEIPSDWSGNDEDLLVEGKPLWSFLEEHIQMSNSALLKDETFLITRIFDARVKSFIKNILLGPGKDKVPISFYSYRVEFQVL